MAEDTDTQDEEEQESSGSGEVGSSMPRKGPSLDSKSDDGPDEGDELVTYNLDALTGEFQSASEEQFLEDVPDAARRAGPRTGFGVEPPSAGAGSVAAELTPRQEWLLASMARQSRVLEALRAATAVGEELEACRAWMALARQAARFLGVAEAWPRMRAAQGVAGEVERHHAALRSVLGEAEAAVAASGPDCRRRAARGLGLRLAVVGKGGAGKTVLCATLARLLARRGRKVLAVDLDANPGLAFSLGLPPSSGGLPPEALEEHPGAAYGWQLASHLSPAEAVARFSLSGPDGVRYLGLGKIDEPEKQAARRSVSAVLQILIGFGDPGWDVIADLEAGPTTPFERYHSFADRVLVVVGPEWRSALTARRLLPVLGDVPTTVVANRFREFFDHPGLVPAVRIPFDQAVREAERAGLAPLDSCPESPAVRAVEELARMLLTPSPEEVST